MGSTNENNNILEERDSYYLKTVRFCLAISGLRRSSQNPTRNTIVVVLILSHMLIGLVGTVHQLLFVPQDINSGTEVLMNVSLIGHSILTYIVLIWNQPKLLNMMDLIESRFNNFSKTYLKDTEAISAAEKANIISIATISAIIFSVHASFIGVSKVYFVSLPIENKSLLFPVTVPFRLTQTTYYSVYFLEVIITVLEAVIHITSITICTGFINILCAEFSNLGRAYRLLTPIAMRETFVCRRKGTPAKLHPEQHLEFHANKILKINVDHHVLLIRFYKDLQSTFGIPIFELFINNQIMLCSSGFHIYRIGAVEQLFKHICMFAALVSHEFVYFWFSSHLNSKVEGFRHDVWGCSWYDRRREFTKTYRIILERLKRSITIQAVILPANLATFAKCLQAALSYFNLLLVLNHKQENIT